MIAVPTGYLTGAFLFMWFGWDDMIGDINQALSSGFYVLGIISPLTILLGLALANKTLDQPE